jgi:hypothetical protein
MDGCLQVRQGFPGGGESEAEPSHTNHGNDTEPRVPSATLTKEQRWPGLAWQQGDENLGEGLVCAAVVCWWKPDHDTI